MRVAQINSVVSTGSTGRIVEAIDRVASARGHKVLTGHGRGRSTTPSHVRIGSDLGVGVHAIKSFLFDGHGLASRSATMRYISQISEWQPDAIALHNIHGYFLHYPTLFDFFRNFGRPVVWTLHDCWPFTGHCSYFDRFDCIKWHTECGDCPMTHYYPSSLVDQSRRNFSLKKKYFSNLENLTIVTPSNWLAGLVNQSFLAGYPVHTIHNGIDLNKFRPSVEGDDDHIVLGVANSWSKRKGLKDFGKLRNLLPSEYKIVLIGLTKAQKSSLPAGVMGIERTETVSELVSWYSQSLVFANPTYSDNFPTTNVEALACGTPVITYATGGSPEAIDDETGRVVPAGDIEQLASAIKDFAGRDRATLRAACRSRASALFDQESRYGEYVTLVEDLVKRSIDATTSIDGRH